MKRSLIALLAVGCGDPPPPPPSAPPVVYEAGAPAWPVMPATTVIGRGVAPARAIPVPITADEALAPIVPGRVFAVPGAEARAAAWGTVGDALVVEVIGVDDGVIRWRDTEGCKAPVVHATAETVVCADANHVVGLDAETGAPRWDHAGVFAGADGDLVVARNGERVLVIAASTGAIAADVKPPVPAGEVERACPSPDGVELWAWDAAGRLARFGDRGGAVDTVALSRPPAKLDPCGDPIVVEIPIPGSAERELWTLARAPLALIAGPVIERGYWRGGAGEVVTATARGIEVRDASLAVLRRTSDAEVGRELSARGTRRLVRGAGGIPVLLDGDRPVATISAPAHPDSAVLGDGHVLGGSWQAPARSLADRLQRFRLPDTTTGVAPVIPPPPAAPPVKSLDLPLESPALDAEITLAGAGAHDVGVIFADPADPAMLYAAPLEHQPDAQRGAGLAALDLRARAWVWHAPDGCPPGMPVATAVGDDVIACGSRGALGGAGAVRAVDKTDGEPRWTWTGATVDAVVATGGIVVVTVGRRAFVLDAADGAVLATVDADDGFVPRLVTARWYGNDAVVTVERGAIVARLPRVGMIPVWSAHVEGVVAALAVAGGAITAELAAGELYLLDQDSGRAIAAAGWGQRWRPVGGTELVIAAAAAPTEWRVEAYGTDGAPRFAVGLALDPPWTIGARGHDPEAAVIVAYGPASRAASLLDPRTGVALRRVTLPDRAVPGAVFATIVDGAPVAGAVLARPLAAVLF